MQSKLKKIFGVPITQFGNFKKSFKKLFTHGSIGITILFFAGISIAYAALTFSGTAVTGDGAVSVDGASTVSIGTVTAPDVTIGRSGHTTTFPGDVTFNGTLSGSGITGLSSGGATATTYECIFPPSTCTITHNLNSRYPVIGIPIVISGSSNYAMGNFLPNSFDVTNLFPADIIIPILGSSAAATDFSLAVSPSSRSITQGGSAVTYTVTQSAINGYSGTVTLSCPSLPTGVTCSFSPTTISGGNTSTLTVNASGSAATGTDSLTVSGTDGTLTHASSSFSLVVTDPLAPDFSLSAGSASISPVFQNSPTSATFLVTQTAINGYSGTTTPSLNSLTGVTCTFSPTTITGSGTSTATCPVTGSSTSNTTSGATNTLVFHATDGTIAHDAGGAALLVWTGPVQQWPMNEGASPMLDTSGHTNNLTNSSVTYTNIAGMLSNTATYNGTSSVSNATNATNTNFSGATPFSACVWMNMSSVSGFTHMYNNLGGGSSIGWSIAIDGSAKKIRVFINGTVGQLNGNYGNNLIAGTTYHVCMAYSGTKTLAGTLIYTNGSLSSLVSNFTDTLTGNISSTQPVSLGEAANGGSWLPGGLAGATVWGYQLSSQQVSALYSQGVF